MATDYGNRLREAREFAGLTQKQAEKKTGIAQSTISTAERLGNGSADTPLYADAYGVDALWLATGNGSMILTNTAALTAPSPTVSATGGPGTVPQQEPSGSTTRRSVHQLGAKLKNASPGRQAAVIALLADYGKDPDRIAKEIDMLLEQDDNPSA